MSVLSRLRRRIMFTCQDANELLVEYLDGELPPEVRDRFESHLSNCDQCSAYLDQYRRTIELAKEGAQPDPPPDLVDVTLAFLREHYEDEQPDEADSSTASS